MLRKALRNSWGLARREFISFSPFLSSQLHYSIAVKPINGCLLQRTYCTTKVVSPENHDTVDPVVFDRICSETLESLCDYFEELVELSPFLKGADITFSDGVLTVDLGSSYGIYVINRQTPNKQIWLSSPTSGPKRYDLVQNNGGYWIYKHDGVTLHQLLQKELTNIVKDKVEFSKCAHSLV